MTTNHADDLRCKLNQAIERAVLLRGSYIDDIRHFSRDRKLPLDALICFLLTMTGGTLTRELYDAGIEMAASSFVDRRKRVDNSCFWNLMKHFNDLCEDPATLKGYRLWAIDGSTIPCPRNPDSSNHFKSETNPKGWNNTHANLIFDILNHTFVDCYMGKDEISSRIAHDEQGALRALIYRRKYREPTIVALDRGYESYNTIAHLQNNPNLYFVLRVKQDKAALRPVRELPMEELDRDLEWTITTRQTNEAKEKRWIFLQTGSKKGRGRVFHSTPAPFVKKFLPQNPSGNARFSKNICVPPYPRTETGFESKRIQIFSTSHWTVSQFCPGWKIGLK